MSWTRKIDLAVIALLALTAGAKGADTSGKILGTVEDPAGNHAQFFVANSVDGNINSATFGYVTHAASPRISQVAAKFIF